MGSPHLDTRAGFIPIPEELQIYNSYAVDPEWQKKFTIIWTSVLAFTTLASVPWVVRAWRSRRLYAGLVIRESMDAPSLREKPRSHSTRAPRGLGAVGRLWTTAWAFWQSVTLWSLPLPTLSVWKSQVADCCRRSYLSLSVGQLFLVAAYIATVVACFTVGVELREFPNRAGFLAIAQLPPLFLLALKSPLPLPVFLPSLSYEHYNFLHRWAGRTTWLATTVHGSLWLNSFLSANQHNQISATKTVRGLIAYACMCMIVVTSLKPVRRRFYQVFWAAHILFVAGFFAAVSYHTPYARPWIWPCVAIYAYDHFVRLLRYKLKDATIVPVDSTMTMIHIPDCDAGWLATQHVNVRVLRGAGIFESHPFTITNAPPPALSGSARGIVLYAKVCGDWTRRLHEMASDMSLELGDDYDEREALILAKEEGSPVALRDHPGRQVQVMIDGPYGGLKLDLGDYESVLVVAGGSGVTFLLGTIEEALSRRERGRGPNKVDVAWVVRDLETIEALAPTMAHLAALASRDSALELTYNLYLTNPPFPLPPVPACLPASTTLSPYRPEVAQLVSQALSLGDDGDKGPRAGLAVVAAGPEGLVQEAGNAVAGLSVSVRVRAGGVGYHGEVYAL